MLTKFDQVILDIICDRVARRNGPGLVDWSVGSRSRAERIVAKAVKASVGEVRAAMTRLVVQEYLHESFFTDDEWYEPITDQFGLRHKAWLEYSRLDVQAILSAWDFDSMQDWLGWDAAGDSSGPDYGPFHVPLGVEVVRLRSRDYEVHWNNKVIWREAYNDRPDIPRTVSRIAADSRTVAEFVCRLIAFLATLPWFDLDFIEGLVSATEAGWQHDESRWADILQTYTRQLAHGPTAVEKANRPNRRLLAAIWHVLGYGE